MTKDQFIAWLSEVVDRNVLDTSDIENGHFSHQADAYDSGVRGAWVAIEKAIENLKWDTFNG